MRSDDMTARARIRDAALALFGAEGVNRVTVRAIAAEAGVSPALVLHHFGSKEGLRTECDAYVIAGLRDGGDRDANLYDVAGLADNINAAAPVRRYLARTLIDGSPDAAGLFDEIVDLTATWLSEGEQAGWAQPSVDARARAAVYVSWLLAPLVLGDHVARVLGVTDLHGMDATMRYSHAMVEMLTNGVFADQEALRAWNTIQARRSGGNSSSKGTS